MPLVFNAEQYLGHSIHIRETAAGLDRVLIYVGLPQLVCTYVRMQNDEAVKVRCLCVCGGGRGCEKVEEVGGGEGGRWKNRYVYYAPECYSGTTTQYNRIKSCSYLLWEPARNAHYTTELDQRCSKDSWRQGSTSVRCNY